MIVLNNLTEVRPRRSTPSTFGSCSPQCGGLTECARAGHAVVSGYMCGVWRARPGIRQQRVSHHQPIVLLVGLFGAARWRARRRGQQHREAHRPATAARVHRSDAVHLNATSDACCVVRVPVAAASLRFLVSRVREIGSSVPLLPRPRDERRHRTTANTAREAAAGSYRAIGREGLFMFYIYPRGVGASKSGGVSRYLYSARVLVGVYQRAPRAGAAPQIRRRSARDPHRCRAGAAPVPPPFLSESARVPANIPAARKAKKTFGCFFLFLVFFDDDDE